MLTQLNQTEKELITAFSRHPFFLNLQSMAWDQILRALIQRRFLSLNIVNAYESVIDLLEEGQAKETVRSILHEEYPRSTRGVPLPSHRELLFQDLLNLGASRTDILCTIETEATKRVRAESFRILNQTVTKPGSQVGAIAALRFWAEVLVGIEYRYLWPKLSERLSNNTYGNKPRSEFYYFHMMHDSRGSDVGQEGFLGGLTHSQELALILNQIIRSPKQLKNCISIETELYQLKCHFYDQFI